jgi:hypothetical protein
MSAPGWLCGKTLETGLGPEECLRTAHEDNRHEGVHLEWEEDDEDGGTA